MNWSSQTIAIILYNEPWRPLHPQSLTRSPAKNRHKRWHGPHSTTNFTLRNDMLAEVNLYTLTSRPLPFTKSDTTGYRDFRSAHSAPHSTYSLSWSIDLSTQSPRLCLRLSSSFSKATCSKRSAIPPLGVALYAAGLVRAAVVP